MATHFKKDTTSIETERLMEISRTLSLQSRPSDVVMILAKTAVSLIRCKLSAVALLEAETGKLGWSGVAGAAIGKLTDRPSPTKDGLIFQAMKSGKPVIENSLADSRAARAELSDCLGITASSLAVIPIMSHQGSLGCLLLIDSSDAAGFSSSDVSLMYSLAFQAGLAIQNTRLGEQLESTSAEVERLDRMKSDFIAIASHELRTPLGLILGHATFIQDFVPEEYAEQMDVIIRSAMRLKELIEDMSAIAHKDQGAARIRGRLFDLSELVEHVVDRFAEQAEYKGIELSADMPPPGTLMVHGDPEKIDVVLDNLVKNAINFTDESGQVGVKAEESEGYAQVFVVDTGIGIPADEVGRVFERFYQVESHLTRKHGGMGLGLSIAKAMVEMHNGRIWCESKEDVGSLFCVMLPMSEAKAEAASKVFKTA